MELHFSEEFEDQLQKLVEQGFMNVERLKALRSALLQLARDPVSGREVFPNLPRPAWYQVCRYPDGRDTGVRIIYQMRDVGGVWVDALYLHRGL